MTLETLIERLELLILNEEADPTSEVYICVFECLRIDGKTGKATVIDINKIYDEDIPDA